MNVTRFINLRATRLVANPTLPTTGIPAPVSPPTLLTRLARPISPRSYVDIADAKERVAVLVLGRDEQELAQFRERNPGIQNEVTLVFIANPRKLLGGYAAVANRFLADRSEDVLGIVHSDTTFASGALARIALAALDHGGQVTGMVGRSIDGRFRWSRDGDSEVSTLDCCSVFLPRSLDLRFDGEIFDDFHCVVEDICLLAASRGVRIFVPRAIANHLGHGSYVDPMWMPNHARYRAALRKKWAGRRFITTCDG